MYEGLLLNGVRQTEEPCSALSAAAAAGKTPSTRYLINSQMLSRDIHSPARSTIDPF